ncbi:MAG: hypothetical protein ABW061_07085 [Polyangiaceae bacterium]
MEGEGGEGGAADTLYNRLGGHDGIRAALGAIVTEEVTDPDIASFFAPQLAPNSTHKPSVDDILDCTKDDIVDPDAPASGPKSKRLGSIARALNAVPRRQRLGPRWTLRSTR